MLGGPARRDPGGVVIRRARLRRAAGSLLAVAGWLWFRLLLGNPVGSGSRRSVRTPCPGSPRRAASARASCIVPMLLAGRSPHVLYRPSEIDDLARRRPRRRHRQGGGRPHPQPLPRPQDLPRHDGRHAPAGDPVRGPARHRQDLHGQGHGPRSRRAVPVRVVVGVPVDVLRPDQPQDPLVLQGAAQGGPRRGRRHRLHRGDRRHRRRPRRHGRRRRARGHRRRRQRAADPAAVLRRADPPATGCSGWLVDAREPLPARRTASCASRRPWPANILVIGATNRAADLDPALLRPGRFDRSVYFDLPAAPTGARSSTTTSPRRPTTPELDDPDRRDTLAAMTAGYSPVMLEHLFDEALVWALRRGAAASTGTTSSRRR